MRLQFALESSAAVPSCSLTRASHMLGCRGGGTSTVACQVCNHPEVLHKRAAHAGLHGPVNTIFQPRWCCSTQRSGPRASPSRPLLHAQESGPELYCADKRASTVPPTTLYPARLNLPDTSCLPCHGRSLRCTTRTHLLLHAARNVSRATTARAGRLKRRHGSTPDPAGSHS